MAAKLAGPSELTILGWGRALTNVGATFGGDSIRDTWAIDRAWSGRRRRSVAGGSSATASRAALRTLSVAPGVAVLADRSGNAWSPGGALGRVSRDCTASGARAGAPGRARSPTVGVGEDLCGVAANAVSAGGAGIARGAGAAVAWRRSGVGPSTAWGRSRVAPAGCMTRSVGSARVACAVAVCRSAHARAKGCCSGDFPAADPGGAGADSSDSVGGAAI